MTTISRSDEREKRIVKFVIPYPNTRAGRLQWTKEYGLNAYWSGKHWARRKADADYWHRLVEHEMNRQQVTREAFAAPVVITFFWDDDLDCSNHAAIAKMIEDAMKGRVIKDDSPKWVKGIEHYFGAGGVIGVVVKEV